MRVLRISDGRLAGIIDIFFSNLTQWSRRRRLNVVSHSNSPMVILILCLIIREIDEDYMKIYFRKISSVYTQILGRVLFIK